MAIIRTNSLIKGISGGLGNLVLRQVRGKTVLAQKNTEVRKESTLQKENRSKFKLASAWAKHILTDPQRKAYYLSKAKKLKLPNAYTAAVADYMRKATITDVIVKAHKKSPNTIQVSTQKKDFQVRKAKVTLYDMNGNVIESGDATRRDYNTFFYTPIIQVNDANVKVVIALDEFLNNTVTREITLSVG